MHSTFYYDLSTFKYLQSPWMYVKKCKEAIDLIFHVHTIKVLENRKFDFILVSTAIYLEGN